MIFSGKDDGMFHRYKGYYEYASKKGVNVGQPVGLDVLVDGTVPTGIVPTHFTFAMSVSESFSL